MNILSLQALVNGKSVTVNWIFRGAATAPVVVTFNGSNNSKAKVELPTSGFERAVPDTVKEPTLPPNVIMPSASPSSSVTILPALSSIRQIMAAGAFDAAAKLLTKAKKVSLLKTDTLDMKEASRKKKDGRKSVKDEQPKTFRRDWRIDTLQRLNR